MNYAQELKTKQVQGIALTPEMRQSLSVLQMSCTELSEFLNREMMENPLLERDESRLPAEDAEEQQIDWTSYVRSCRSDSIRTDARESGDEEAYTFEKYAHSDMTYREILDMQFRMLSDDLTPRQIRIGWGILDAIRDDGYLSADTEDLALSLDVGTDEVEELLKQIQTFYPSGTGARNVAECLYLQLLEDGSVSPEYETLLFDYLEEVAGGRLEDVEKRSGISREVQRSFLKRIRDLHPRPGNRFAGSEKTHYVIPDGSISWVSGGLTVKLNSIGTPPLTISSFYRNMLTSPACTEETRLYITERLNRALLLIQNIAAREKTIESIASVVAQEQADYLLGKTDTLKPLTQKQIAKRTGLHESTVSRTVRGKYFLTPRGTFELQALFCSSFSSGNEGVTTDAIRKELRLLIEGEDRQHPLSDQKLADILSEKLVAIARRTVAKYREEMGIQTASKRRLRAL
ncbi:MAG: RNA polymerase factor sigma-54 [Lachnospiraceae bacterium]|nr:RNA polymerase factor sigma-54 [Lachnospiraceae bacterium]